MKLHFISDTHSHHQHLTLGTGDVFIHCGDFTRKGSLEDTEKFARFMSSQQFDYKIVIAGNHDFCFEDERKKQAEHYLHDNGIIYLNDSGIDIEGIKIWGSPIQPEYHNWAFNRERGEEIRQHWQLIPNDLDVLITHGPPFGVLDLCSHGGRVGCEDLLQTIQQIKPKIHAFGHIHEAYGVENRDDTQFINACSIDIPHMRHINKKNPLTTNAPIILDIPKIN